MTLTTPLALLGLLALPLIVALHMLRSRSQQVRVSSLTLWGFLSPQLRGASARRIPLTWLLILDLLIAAVLSIALAGPRLPLTRTVLEGRHLILILDTSTSMAANDSTQARFTSALTDLQSLVRNRRAQDVLTVIEFGRRTSVLADSRSQEFSAQLETLGALAPGGTGRNLDTALALALAAVDPETPAETHIFTDAAYDAPPAAAFELPIVWHLYGNTGANQAVLTVDALALSESKFQVFARFANFSDQAVTRNAILLGDGRLLDEVAISLDPGTSLTQSWEILGTAASVTVVLDGEDALAADDFAAGVLPAVGDTGAQLSVALVADQPGPILRALEAAPATLVQVISPGDYLPGSPFDMIVFRGNLPERWPEGTVLVVDPPTVSSLLGTVLPENVTELPFPQPDPLLEGVDLTGVRWSRAWSLERFPSGLESVLSTGSLPLILKGRTGLTDLVLLLAETADENGTPAAFARHPAFPVLVANIIQQAAGASFPTRLTLGTSLPLPPADRYPAIRIVDPGGAVAELGSDRPTTWNLIRTPGIYESFLTDLDGDESHFLTAVNAGDLDESDIAPQNWPAGIASPAVPAVTSEQPLSLTPWLLGLAAALLVLEAWLSWR